MDKPGIRQYAPLMLIIAAAFILRVWGNSWGLPMIFNRDESAFVETGYRIITRGDLNPHWFNYPSLLMYLNAIIYKTGSILHDYNIIRLPYRWPYQAARNMTAIFGTLTIIPAYLIGKTLYSHRTGLASAAFLACMPLAVEYSHYAVSDIPVTFFITLGAYYSIRLATTGKRRYYLAAGLAAGLGASTKYNAILLLFTITCAHILFKKLHGQTHPKKIISKNILLSYATSVLAFLATTPYAILARPEFLKAIVFEVEHMKAGHGFVFLGSAPGWIFHLTETLPDALTFPLFAASLAGFAYICIKTLPQVRKTGLSATKKTETIGAIIIASWIIPYFLIIGSWQVKFARYVIPLLPFLAVTAAKAAELSAEKIRTQAGKQFGKKSIPLVFTILTLIILAPPVTETIKTARSFTITDTRQTALDWINESIPAKSSILREGYTPEVSLLRKYRDRQVFFMAEHPHRRRFPSYDPDYVITSSFTYNRYYEHPEDAPLEINFYNMLDQQHKLIKEFKPQSGSNAPTIKIYKVNK